MWLLTKTVVHGRPLKTSSTYGCRAGGIQPSNLVKFWPRIKVTSQGSWCINGTSNFHDDQMVEECWTYEDALAEGNA